MNKAILATGANGFVSRSVLDRLMRYVGCWVLGKVRQMPDGPMAHANTELVRGDGSESATASRPGSILPLP